MRRSRIPLILATATLVAALFVVPMPAEAYPGTSVVFEGHGWGHGRGMGQYGALGYAVDHGWDYRRILEHFYGGTVRGGIPDILMTVRLTRFDGIDTIVVQEKGQLKVSTAPDSTFNALLVRRTSANHFQIYRSDYCGGPWIYLQDADGPVRLWSQIYTGADDHTTMLQMCEPGSNRWLRGEIVAVDDGGTHRTVNPLGMESYLRAVVPRESPASWGDLAGGAGMQALRAQAVAARSYGASEQRYWYAKTCDTTSCQVYAGRAVQDANGFRILEDGRTDRAISETAGEVRLKDGVPARTEFSSSTGGWTAGGTFPAVPDDGDDISINPNHFWQVSIPVSTVEAAWPSIGRLVTFSVTRRNGYGDWGGRALEARLEGTSGTVTPSGNEVRSKLGLKSDWFRVLAPGGYWLVAGDGGVFTFGDAAYSGGMAGRPLAKPIVGMARSGGGNGYWLVAGDGGVFAFGDAPFLGNMAGQPLAAPVVGMARTPSGNGYWLVAGDGGVFAFGDAPYLGGMSGRPLAAPVVGMAATPSGNGYWLAAGDGGVFAFGDAPYLGGMAGRPLAAAVVGMASTPSGGGYRLAAKDGGVFTFGDAGFFGGMAGRPLAKPVVGIVGTKSGLGYWLVAGDGGVFTFGDGGYFGSMAGKSLAKPGVGMAPTATS